MRNIIYKTLPGLAVFVVAGLLAGCDKDETGYNPNGPTTVESFIPVQGGVGTEILITGKNLNADTSQISVTLNGKRMRIIGANERQMMVVVPARAGSGPLEIKINDNTTITGDEFTYVYSRVVTTLAGSGEAGYLDGQGEDAMFSFNGQSWYRSHGIAVDDDLNVYIADPGNHCIRKIDSLGNVTTLAGDPNASGHADGQGSIAKFNAPYSVSVDNEGNIYSTDPLNWDIRKITPDGTATTIAWANQEPWSIAVDKATSNVYYLSSNPSGNIYQVSPDGVTTQVISGLNYPAGLAVGPTGDIYVASNGDQVILRFAAGTWEKEIIAGQVGVLGYENGSGTKAKFSYPWGLTTDADGNVYVAGNGSVDGGPGNADQSIRFIEAGTWQVSTFAGSNVSGYTNAVGQAAAFAGPSGVAVDKHGNAYVLDKNNNAVRKITLQ